MDTSEDDSVDSVVVDTPPQQILQIVSLLAQFVGRSPKDIPINPSTQDLIKFLVSFSRHEWSLLLDNAPLVNVGLAKADQYLLNFARSLYESTDDVLNSLGTLGISKTQVLSSPMVKGLIVSGAKSVLMANKNSRCPHCKGDLKGPINIDTPAYCKSCDEYIYLEDLNG